MAFELVPNGPGVDTTLQADKADINNAVVSADAIVSATQAANAARLAAVATNTAAQEAWKQHDQEEQAGKVQIFNNLLGHVTVMNEQSQVMAQRVQEVNTQLVRVEKDKQSWNPFKAAAARDEQANLTAVLENLNVQRNMINASKSQAYEEANLAQHLVHATALAKDIEVGYRQQEELARISATAQNTIADQTARLKAAGITADSAEKIFTRKGQDLQQQVTAAQLHKLELSDPSSNTILTDYMLFAQGLPSSPATRLAVQQQFAGKSAEEQSAISNNAMKWIAHTDPTTGTPTVDPDTHINTLIATNATTNDLEQAVALTGRPGLSRAALPSAQDYMEITHKYTEQLRQQKIATGEADPATGKVTYTKEDLAGIHAAVKAELGSRQVSDNLQRNVRSASLAISSAFSREPDQVLRYDNILSAAKVLTDVAGGDSSASLGAQALTEFVQAPEVKTILEAPAPVVGSQQIFNYKLLALSKSLESGTVKLNGKALSRSESTEFLSRLVSLSNTIKAATLNTPDSDMVSELIRSNFVKPDGHALLLHEGDNIAWYENLQDSSLRQKMEQAANNNSNIMQQIQAAGAYDLSKPLEMRAHLDNLAMHAKASPVTRTTELLKGSIPFIGEDLVNSSKAKRGAN